MHNSMKIRNANILKCAARYLQLSALALAVTTMFSFSSLWSATAAAQGTTLNEITYSTLPGDGVQVRLTMSAPVNEPLSFSIDNPSRIAFDFPGVGINLPRKTERIGVGIAQSVTAVQAAGRTRVVVSLDKLVPYDVKVEDKTIVVTLNPSGGGNASAFQGEIPVPAGEAKGIENVDFRRGENGEGRVIIQLSDPSTIIDTREEGGRIVVEFVGTNLPDELSRKLDVVDFATPVKSIDTAQRGKNVVMTVASTGLFEHIAYQSDNLFTLDVKPLTEEELEELKKDTFTGERLSLNFQNIEVRAVLQLIADFTGLNLVASDTVSGSLTLRLKNVPWDQALDIILKTKGLAIRQTDNVILVAPSEEIVAREEAELEALKKKEELAPLRTEFIRVNYARANEMARILQEQSSDDSNTTNTLLTERGSVSIDSRTNTLLIRDTAEALAQIRTLVRELDIPVRQVLIESRIVVADDSFNRDLGVRFGLSKRETLNTGTPSRTFLGGGTLPGNTDFGGTVAFNDGTNENLITDLFIAAPSGAIGLAVAAIPDTLLQLELQAMQVEGRGEVLSNPRVITANQRSATIEQGTEIPFQEASSSGASTTSFKKAVLSLTVLPQITPDDRIIMDLSVTQDSQGEDVFGGVPVIDTRRVTTQVLVDNGDTVVLGGIFEQTKRKDVEKVPFFGDLPYLGFLFRQTSEVDDKTELLIFVTPKILKEVLTGG